MDRPSYSVYIKWAVRYLDMVCEPQKTAFWQIFAIWTPERTGYQEKSSQFSHPIRKPSQKNRVPHGPTMTSEPPMTNFWFPEVWIRHPSWRISSSMIFCWMVLVYFPVIFRILKVKLVRFLQMKMLSIKCLLSSPASSWVVGGLGIRWNPVRPRRQDYYDPFQIHYGTLASRRSRHGAARLRFSFRPEHVWKNPTETPWYLNESTIWLWLTVRHGKIHHF
jgi:hypothetical protein